MPGKCSIAVDSYRWKQYGGRMMRWINEHISDDCYRFRFGSYGDPVEIIFQDESQAFIFNLCVLMGDVRDLE